MEGNKDLERLIKLTGERAKIDAKANGTYVVYKDPDDNLVKEYFDGTKEFLNKILLHIHCLLKFDF